MNSKYSEPNYVTHSHYSLKKIFFPVFKILVLNLKTKNTFICTH